jgi:gluconate 2-dehydrogenase gamma chain
MSADAPDRTDLISRRALLGRVGAAGALAAVPERLAPAAEAAQAPRPISREPLETLTAAEADALEAITERLIPGDASSPGAAEARAAHYIDRALGGALAAFRDAYRAGLAAVDAYARSSKGLAFAQLQASDQDALLAEMERNGAAGFEGGSAPFFNLLLGHTVQGTFGDPHYGGNRNFAGWDLLGYPGIRLAVTADQQRLGERPSATHMSAYDYSMFSGRRPARAGLAPSAGVHGD